MAAAASRMKGQLAVTVHKASELRDVQTVGKQDPYVKLEVGKEHFKTKTHDDGGKNPVWEQGFVFNLDGTEDFLHLTVWDKEVLADNQIGRADIDLKALADCKEAWFNVNDQANFKKVVGKILLTGAFTGTGGPAKKEEPKPAAAPAPAPAPVQAPVQPVVQQPQVVYVQAPPQPQVVYMQAPQPQVVYVQQPVAQPQVVVQAAPAPVVVQAAPAPVAPKLPVGVNVFITNVAHGKQLGQDGKAGYIHKNKAGWEKMVIVGNHNGYLIHNNDHKQAPNLGAKPGGEVYAHANKAGWETWFFEPTASGNWRIKSAHGTYLAARVEGDRGIVYHGNASGSTAEEWQIYQA